MKKKVLVVDDVITNIEFLRYSLSKANYDVVAVRNGTEALKEVHKHDFDLILLDIMMPQLSGFEVCERLKAQPAFADIPVIFLTAKTDTDSVVKGFLYGAIDYMTKPFNRMALLARVNVQISNYQMLKTKKRQLNMALSSLEELQQSLSTEPLNIENLQENLKNKIEAIKQLNDVE